MIIQAPTLNAIRVARVCHVHPEGHTFDGIFCDTGDYCRNVQVLSPMAGTDFGFSSGIPAPEEEGWDENREINPDRRDVLAVVTTCSAGLLCLGFLYPQVNHLAFTKAADKNRLINRHPSDWYQTVDDDGNMEMVHPSGAFVIMSQGTAPTNLSGRDYDKRWILKRNTGRRINIRAQVNNAFVNVKQGEVLASVGSNRIRISQNEIEIVAPIIRITGNIIHVGNNTQAGIHTDSSGPHTA